jgi:hypothetical protein
MNLTCAFANRYDCPQSHMSWLVMLAAFLAVAYGQKIPSIGVFIDFDAVPSRLAVAEMQKEAGAILHAAGYLLDWRLLKDNQGTESFTNVVVVKFKGQCRVEHPSLVAEDAEEAVTLASTLVSEGHVLPFSEVRCDEVRKALPYAAPSDRPTALGRALGRIVAHELHHLLADTTRHAAAGLAKATHDWLELISTPSRPPLAEPQP